MSAGLEGVADVVGYIAKSIDNFDTDQMNALHWRNSEVLELLTEIQEGLAAEPAPTWAEVTISEVLAERDELRRDVERGRTVVKNAADLAASSPLSMQEATEALLRTTDVWFQMVDAQAAEKRMRGERDRARATAVRLEQELASAEAYLRKLLPPLPSQIRETVAADEFNVKLHLLFHGADDRENVRSAIILLLTAGATPSQLRRIAEMFAKGLLWSGPVQS